MRSAFLGGAAILLLAVPSHAADVSRNTPDFNDPAYGMVGEVEIGAGIIGAKTPDSVTLGQFQGAGRVNVPLAGTWNFEAEVTGSAFVLLGGVESQNGLSLSSLGPYGHVWTKLASGAVGAFAGVDFGSMMELTVATAGVEGQIYLGNTTLGGQAAYDRVLTEETSANAWQARGYAAYYFTPNSKIAGGVEYVNWGNLEMFEAGHLDKWRVTGSIEHRFDNTPFSVWGSASYASLQEEGYDPVDTWRGMLGVRLFFDPPGSTLQGHDREVPFQFDTSLLTFY